MKNRSSTEKLKFQLVFQSIFNPELKSKRSRAECYGSSQLGSGSSLVSTYLSTNNKYSMSVNIAKNGCHGLKYFLKDQISVTLSWDGAQACQREVKRFWLTLKLQTVLVSNTFLPSLPFFNKGLQNGQKVFFNRHYSLLSSQPVPSV